MRALSKLFQDSIAIFPSEEPFITNSTKGEEKTKGEQEVVKILGGGEFWIPMKL